MDPRSGSPGPSRRQFLAAGAAAAAGAVLATATPAPAEPEPDGEEPDALPRRPLGRTGFKAALFGLGCFPLGSLPDDDAAVRVILRALDAGCNYLDTAPSYAGGRSEKRVATALAERPDHEVFLATKTHARKKDDARRDLEASLDRLRAQRVDLVQVHAVKDAADLERVMAKGGTLEALAAAKEEGLVRFIGVTGHTDPEVVRAAFDGWDFDAVLFPLNCVDVHHLSFETGTLPAAVKKGLGRVAMKAFASGNLVAKGIEAELCLRYVYGLDVSTAIIGCRTTAEVDLAVRIARENRPMSAKERKELLIRTAPIRGTGVEWYKRS